MTFETAIFLFCAGVIGGAMNAVAGGGSFVAFPALLFTGVPPIPANATNTISLWTAAAASGGAYRKRLNVSRRIVIPLFTASLFGGLTGALLLLRTPGQTFMRILPWLISAATLLFAFGKRLARTRKSAAEYEISSRALVAATVFQFAAGTYGGYFGGGMGIAILAMLTALGMTDIHAMNALKIVMSFLINGVAVVAFMVAGVIYWHQAIVMIFGGILGGYLGAHFAQKLPPVVIRSLVVVIGAGMSIYFFVKVY